MFGMAMPGSPRRPLRTAQDLTAQMNVIDEESKLLQQVMLLRRPLGPS